MLEAAGWDACFRWLLGLNACSSGDPLCAVPSHIEQAATVPASTAWRVARPCRMDAESLLQDCSALGQNEAFFFLYIMLTDGKAGAIIVVKLDRLTGSVVPGMAA